MSDCELAEPAVRARARAAVAACAMNGMFIDGPPILMPIQCRETIRPLSSSFAWLRKSDGLARAHCRVHFVAARPRHIKANRPA